MIIGVWRGLGIPGKDIHGLAIPYALKRLKKVCWSATFFLFCCEHSRIRPLHISVYISTTISTLAYPCAILQCMGHTLIKEICARVHEMAIGDTICVYHLRRPSHSSVLGLLGGDWD